MRGYRIAILCADDCTLTRSRLSDNGFAGIRVLDPASEVVLTGNVLQNNTSMGLVAVGKTHIVSRGNRYLDNGHAGFLIQVCIVCSGASGAMHSHRA